MILPPHNAIPLPRQPPLGTLNPKPLPNLTNNASRFPTNNTPTRNNHAGRHSCAIEHNSKILDNRHTPYRSSSANLHMVPQRRSLDDGALADEDMVSDFERVEGVHASM